MMLLKVGIPIGFKGDGALKAIQICESIWEMRNPVQLTGKSLPVAIHVLFCQTFCKRREKSVGDVIQNPRFQFLWVYTVLAVYGNDSGFKRISEA